MITALHDDCTELLPTLLASADYLEIQKMPYRRHTGGAICMTRRLRCSAVGIRAAVPAEGGKG